jgi:hypothetical protein
VQRDESFNAISKSYKRPCSPFFPLSPKLQNPRCLSHNFCLTFPQEPERHESIENMAEQKTAIITGCSSGIGLATALLFLKKGYRVFGIDRVPFDPEKLESGSAKDFQFHKTDIVEDGACDVAVKACVEAFG